MANLRSSFINPAGIFLLAIALLIPISVPAQNIQKDKGAGNIIASNNERRLALVIGNAEYKIKPLNNPVNDANALAQTLRESSFEVMTGFNLNKTEIDNLIFKFGEKLRAQKGVGLFYYSGHGIQVKGENFLLPVDFDIDRVSSEDLVDNYATSVDFIINTLDDAENNANILILDACRDNPFESRLNKSQTVKGLASVNASRGMFIAYSTAPNKIASDGNKKLSPYTGSLVRQTKINGQNIFELFARVSGEVSVETEGRQVPWNAYSLNGSICLSNCSQSTQSVSPGAPDNPAHAPVLPLRTAMGAPILCPYPTEFRRGLNLQRIVTIM